MKTYVKPTLEVISMKTTENIADNLIKTIYTRTSEATGFVMQEDAATYDATRDLQGSDISE